MKTFYFYLYALLPLISQQIRRAAFGKCESVTAAVKVLVVFISVCWKLHRLMQRGKFIGLSDF